MSLVTGLLRPRLFSSKLSKLKVTEKYSGSATLPLKANNKKHYCFKVLILHNTQKTIRQKIFTPGISELTVQTGRVRSEIINKDRYKNTAAFFVIPLLSQFLEEKNYCERRNELSRQRPVALPNRHKHLCLFKLGYDVHALLSSVMYILSGKKITVVYPMSRRR
jgi:hypothetical protein